MAVAIAAGCGGKAAGPSTPARKTHLFAYDRKARLGLRDRGVVNHHYPIKIHDVSYRSPKGGRVTAYLVEPPGKGPFAGVVYLHGTGGTRLELLPQATWLAARGAVALVIDSPFARSHKPQIPSGIPGLHKQRDLEAQTIVDLRRAVDVLQSLPAVDDHRIGFVGYSSGAKSGAILAGVEHRIRAFDLMSGGAAPVTTYTRAAPQKLRARLAAILGDVDPLRYVRNAAPARLFFQDGRLDEVVPRALLLDLFYVASRPKQLRWYTAGHNLNNAAYADQLMWLARTLAVRGPSVKGAVLGPPRS
jgi:dienelactone hydrolase